MTYGLCGHKQTNVFYIKSEQILFWTNFFFFFFFSDVLTYCVMLQAFICYCSFVRCFWCARACVCVVHWHCTAQLSMFNMEKRYRNKIIIIIIIITKYKNVNDQCAQKLLKLTKRTNKKSNVQTTYICHSYKLSSQSLPQRPTITKFGQLQDTASLNQGPGCSKWYHCSV